MQNHDTTILSHIDAVTLAESYLDEAETLLQLIYKLEADEGRRHSRIAVLAGLGQRAMEEAGNVFADQAEAMTAKRKGVRHEDDRR